jgi:hypothetical protein
VTELIWVGKLRQGRSPGGAATRGLPFQTVGTVNESAQERQKALDLFAGGRESEWRNRLIWGDKGSPFETSANFSFQVEINGESFVKEPAVIE